MAKNEFIEIFCFGEEIGKLGFDENLNKSFFQYNPIFLESGKYNQLFPKTGIIKRITQAQGFSQYNNETFKGLPPMIADSLPDMFGNLIFKTWLESKDKSLSKISVLEQLAYVANRGMGALEFRPAKNVSQHATIDIEEVVTVLKNVLSNKEASKAQKLSTEALLTIFKIGSSAGGVRPKILISENKETGNIIPGDINYSDDYYHYLIKLDLEDKEVGYPRESVEYAYYLTIINLGINMMPSKLIDGKHFATERFDRVGGKKKHALTATGMTGWDFTKPENSSYENLFELATFLKIPRIQIEELYRRMILNIVFCNKDDHLKNHSFIYNKTKNSWSLSPAYDITYSLNPLLNYKRTSRVLSVNNKRVDLLLSDVLQLAEIHTIKNPKGIIRGIQKAIPYWEDQMKELEISQNIIDAIKGDFVLLI